MEPLKKGFARIEFFAVMQDIKKLLAEGYSIKLAYDNLKEAGKLTMSYQAFYKNLKQMENSVTLASTTNQSERKLGMGKYSTIQHEKKPNLDDII